MPCANLLSIKIDTKSKESVLVTGTSTEKSSMTIATTTSPPSQSFAMEPMTPLDSKEGTTSPKYSTSLWVVIRLVKFHGMDKRTFNLQLKEGEFRIGVVKNLQKRTSKLV